MTSSSGASRSSRPSASPPSSSSSPTRSSRSPGRRSRSSASRSSGRRPGTRTRTSTARSTFIYGTIVTSFIALLLATPLSIAIALFLTELAPRRARARRSRRWSSCSPRSRASCSASGASSSSAPGCAQHLEPWLQSWFGFLPIFSATRPAGRRPAGGARADDHDHPDHLGDLPRAVQPRSARSHGRLARPRRRPAGRRSAASRSRTPPRGIVGRGARSASAARSARPSPSRR